MSDRPPVEFQETAPPLSLLSLEEKTYTQLPEDFKIADKGAMTTFRLISNRTQRDHIENGGLLVNRGGVLSVEDLMAGAGEFEGPGIDVEDWSGITQIPTDDVLLQAKIDWLGNTPETYRLFVFGRELTPEMFVGKKIPSNVTVKTGAEFSGLVHGHPSDTVHSPIDFTHMSVQGSRLDNRPVMPISIVVGKNDMYMLVIPTDGNVEYSGTSAIGNPLSGIKGNLLQHRFLSTVREGEPLTVHCLILSKRKQPNQNLDFIEVIFLTVQ